MVVRTISQLPTVDGSTLASQSGKVFVEVSIPASENNKYVSRKAELSSINEKSNADLSSKMVQEYGLRWAGSNTAIKLNTYAQKIDSIANNNYTLGGIKTFTKFPAISPTAVYPTGNSLSYYGNSEDNVIPNVKRVKELVTNTPSFVSTTDSVVAEGSPFRTFSGNAVDYTGSSICYREFQNSDRFYFWNISDGKKDSSETIYDQTDGSLKHFVEIRDTGYLVIWGWITGGGAIPAEMSWVGLFGRMKYEGDNTSIASIPLQIQPWIQGSKSTDMQYIGFGLPVKKGLQLNIRTGFPVVGGSTGAFQSPGSLTFQDGWIPNSFVGYVIKTQE